MKICTVCKEEKSLDEFYARAASEDGKAYRCKLCDKKAGKEYHARHYVKARRGHIRALIKHNYGLTLEERDFLFGKGCEICGTTEIRLAIDHDHEKGKGSYRGCLCVRCNAGIGNFKENPDIMLKAIEYLKKHKDN